MPRGDWADVDGAEDPASLVFWLDVSRQSQAVTVAAAIYDHRSAGMGDDELCTG